MRKIKVIRGQELSKLHPQEKPISKVKGNGNGSPKTIYGNEISSLW